MVLPHESTKLNIVLKIPAKIRTEICKKPAHRRVLTLLFIVDKSMSRIGLVLLNTNEFLEAPIWVPILWSLNTTNNVYFACIAAQTLKTQSQRSLI